MMSRSIPLWLLLPIESARAEFSSGIGGGDVAGSFQTGSGLSPTDVANTISTIAMIAITVWAGWAIYTSLKNVSNGRQDVFNLYTVMMLATLLVGLIAFMFL